MWLQSNEIGSYSARLIHTGAEVRETGIDPEKPFDFFIKNVFIGRAATADEAMRTVERLLEAMGDAGYRTKEPFAKFQDLLFRRAVTTARPSFEFGSLSPAVEAFRQAIVAAERAIGLPPAPDEETPV